MLVIGSYRSEDNRIIWWGRGSGDHIWLLKRYRLKVQGCNIKNQIYVVMEAKWLAVLRPRCEGPGPHFLVGPSDSEPAAQGRRPNQQNLYKIVIFVGQYARTERHIHCSSSI